MLIGGADCGPSNPLQNLSQRFDQDRGIQQDHFSSARAGPSRETFRTQGSRGPDQDAARFFSSSTMPQLVAPAPFDLSGLHHTLPGAYSPTSVSQNPASASWASDFMQQQQPPSKSSGPQIMSPTAEAQFERERPMDVQMASAGPMPQGSVNWNPGFSNGYRMNSMPAFAPQMPMRQQSPMVQSDQAVWEKEFDSIEGPLDTTVSNLPSSQQMSATSGTQQEVQPKQHTPQEADELARTAGLLVESVRDEGNPKFQNSQFMGLMKQLRDGEVVVEGDKMVEKGFGVSGARWANDFQMDVKGKGREVDMPTQDVNLSPSTDQLDARRAYRSFIRGFSPTRAEVRSLAANPSIEETTVHREEDPNDAYFQQENAEYIQYWNAHHTEPTEHATVTKSQSADWDRMQQQWDQFEANSTGIKHVEVYQFQDNNPYLLGDRSRTRQHMAHLNGPQSFYESVLELEAAVQRDPNNASAWYELGVKQQENEREHKAIQALRHSIDLDSSHLPTWVALAVSYANDSDRTETYNAINEWVKRNTLYQDTVQRYRAEFPDDPTAPSKERFSKLIECLISMARSDMDGNIDPDTQVALAILLNTNEDYEKAQDCFRTALAVRPDDWLLYNRVGATMANSGRADEALQYYYRALELNPAYIRARFNLGISCINLRRYEEAAQHILDALVLQDSDGVHDTSGVNDTRGVTSSALWDSLKTTCLHMQRIDLASFCDRRNLEGIRVAFQNHPSV